jgi:hypothetical protein
MYLICSSYADQCDHNVVLGICKNMRELTEIVWNFSRFILHTTGNTYEENNDLINIYKINEDDYKTLDKLYRKYEVPLSEYMEKSVYCKNYKVNNFGVCFWYGVFDSEEKKDILFLKSDCKLIIDIIKRSQVIE